MYAIMLLFIAFVFIRIASPLHFLFADTKINVNSEFSKNIENLIKIVLLQKFDNPIVRVFDLSATLSQAVN